MSQIPSELRYSESHEWARKEDDGTVTVGITHHAQELLGDLVFVELPEVEDEIHAGDEAGVVESVKAASDLFAPVTGEVIEVNEALIDNPALINEDPYGGGWIFKIRPVDEDEVDELMDADEYHDHIESEAH